MRTVVVGASWGGLRAVSTVLAGLPADFGAPVLIAQHRGAGEDDAALSELLGRRSALPVAEAEDKSPLAPGRVLVAPAGLHLLVEDDGVVGLSLEAPVNFSRPSIDVLFESAAAGYGDGVIGVVLTGANADGAEGLAAVAARGGTALVQDPADAERSEMPRAALSAVPGARVLALEDVAPVLAELCA